MTSLIPLLFLIAAIIAVVLFFKRLSHNNADIIGEIGEQTVAKILKKLPDEYFTLNDIILQDSNFSTQIDHVVLSCYGIFVIETKNYTGKIYGNEESYQWTQNIYGNKYHLYNPIKQNNTHVNALSKLLHLPKDYFFPIVVFLNEAELHCFTQSPVIYASQILNEIQNHQFLILTPAKIDSIINILNVATLENHDTREKHLIHTKENIAQKNSLIQNGICPNCNSPLVKRNGRYGYFLGCSNFPRCKFTMPL